MLVIVGTRTEAHFLRSQVGMGSNKPPVTEGKMKGNES